MHRYNFRKTYEQIWISPNNMKSFGCQGKIGVLQMHSFGFLKKEPLWIAQVSNIIWYKTLYLIPTFAGHTSSSYSSYEDDIDNNRILIQKSTILKAQTFKISCLRLVYKQNIFHKNKKIKSFFLHFFGGGIFKIVWGVSGRSLVIFLIYFIVFINKYTELSKV